VTPFRQAAPPLNQRIGTAASVRAPSPDMFVLPAAAVG